MNAITKEEVFVLHESGKPGKLGVVLNKSINCVEDLARFYSPGVAYPCIAIAKDEILSYKYTSKGNFVAIISNGTAVLGLGNLGAAASKPVMEGKAILLKHFAQVDAIDIEIFTENVEDIIKTIFLIGKTWGGINLEDIKAPECFEIEERLQEMLDIPVFHDDQHGTAVVILAGLINAFEITGRNFQNTKIIVNGAGAAAIACAELLKSYGLKKENIILCDTKGVIYKGRTEGMNKYKEKHAIETNMRTLEEAISETDVFIGVSVKDALKPEWLKKMNKNPIIFAMANPDPEITPANAKAIRDDVIIGTGRSDYPNQINNLLCFPYLFRGALDVMATKITTEMKIAVAVALAKLAKEPVMQEVKEIYKDRILEFGKEYLIPTPFDKRLFHVIPIAVAEMAIKQGIARKKIDIEEYKQKLITNTLFQ